MGLRGLRVLPMQVPIKSAGDRPASAGGGCTVCRVADEDLVCDIMERDVED
jgi:hypothetical protein